MYYMVSAQEPSILYKPKFIMGQLRIKLPLSSVHKQDSALMLFR